MSKISIQTVVPAPAGRAYAYYTEPRHIVRWNYADESWHCPEAINDLQVGGRYYARMEAKDASMGFDFYGTYTQVQEGESFTYELEDGRAVMVQFQETEQGTRVEVEFDPEQENSEDFQRAGWQAILDNYAAYVGYEESA
ncbi:SRPBCC domain-containing protein [Corynebacterium oculi]|uniref:Activator of Hsp90 ATPase homologue 1/2-like C-terminal domain-containing protein n=1 Tax=Corynebacterium oculi TaxID=1544416 RepID=A0A0Q0YF12_9CORY|nr:SRPBCC domain-containing protein [Corynebacterium oculi]KQB85008.1 hypothetical protein Cocul_00141 [Corynebacterium oculi]